MNRGSMALSLMLALFAGAGTVDAKDKDRKMFDARPITSRWRVVGGTNLSSFTTNAAFSPTGLVGGFINVEDDLGLEEEIDTFVVGATYRLSDRHRLEAALTDLDRHAVRTLDEQIEWGDVTYDVGAQVTTDFRTSLFRFKWKYSFSDSGRLDAGMSAGLATFNFDVSLAGQGTVDDGMGGTAIQTSAEGAEFIAPVPLIGFWVDYAFTPHWIVRFTTEALDLSVSSYEGRVLQSAFTAEYYVSKLVGLGFGITNSDLQFSQDEENERLGVRYKVKSFTGYLSFAF